LAWLSLKVTEGGGKTGKIPKGLRELVGGGNMKKTCESGRQDKHRPLKETFREKKGTKKEEKGSWG